MQSTFINSIIIIQIFSCNFYRNNLDSECNKESINKIKFYDLFLFQLVKLIRLF